MTSREARAELRESKAACRAQIAAAKAEYERQVRRARAGYELAVRRLEPSIDPVMHAWHKDVADMEARQAEPGHVSELARLTALLANDQEQGRRPGWSRVS